MRNKIIESDIKYVTDANLPWSSFDNKTVLISGASGFLSSYLVETFLYLKEKNNINVNVIGLVRDLKKAEKKFQHARNNLRFLVQDVCDPISVDEKIDYIIHTASLATPKVFRTNPVDTILPNIVGTKNLLELGVKNNVKCFLFFSTSGVHGYVGDADFPIKEDTCGSLNQMDLESCYLESKKMGENLCVAWGHQFDIPFKIVRPAITYGPGIALDDGRSFADFIACLVNDNDIELYSDGRVLRNFCYIADATLGFFTVLLKGKTGEAYNIATDHEISIKNLAYYLVESVFPEKNLKVIMKTDPNKNFLRVEYSRTAVDITKAKALGWNLFFPIDEGFKRAIASYTDAN